jgi:tetratricopeptide (TPR) repeat protein
MAANSYELRKDNASARLKEFFYKHPYTPFYDKTNLMLGILEFEQKKYESAISYFNNINHKKLSFRERTDYLFSKGYACIATERYTEAVIFFVNLKRLNTRFHLTAIYIYSTRNIALGNYTLL